MGVIPILIDFVQKFGGWGIGILALLFFLKVLLDEDRSALFRGRIYKLIYKATGKLEVEKKYIANDIKGRLNLARRRAHYGKHVLPRAVDVVWAETGVGTTQDIREGAFIVRLGPSTKQEKNIALLATAIVRRTTLEGIRHSVEPPLQTAIDLNLVRLLLGEARNTPALEWFLSNEYRPQIQANNQTRIWNEQILAMDERGLFTRILLVELEAFSRRIYGMAPRPYMVGEVEGLVEFLHRIAIKEFGQEVPLQFHRAYIRVAIIIVAKTAKLLRSIEPYVRMMHSQLQREFRSVYVLAFDKDWLGEVDPEAHRQFEERLAALCSELDKATVAVKDFDEEFLCVDQEGKRRQARCIRYLAPGT